MTNSFVQLPADGTGKKLETKLLNDGAQDVHREAMVIGDPDTYAAVGKVLNANPAGTEYGLVVRNIPSGTQVVSGTITANAGTGTFIVDMTDEPAREVGLVGLKSGTNNIGDVDVLSLPALPAGSNNIGDVDFAQYVPQDVDTGAPVVNALPVVIKKSAAGAPDFGTSTDPYRVDPTGTTTQPVSIAATVVVDVTDEAAREVGLVGLKAGINNIGDVDVLTLPGIVGTKSNNGGVPGATNLGVLPVVATAAAPTYTEGNQAALSTDLAGLLRTIIGSALPAGTNNIGDIDILSIAAGDNNIGNVDIVTMPAVDVTDEATRDLGKVDIASLDQYTPIDVDSGGPVLNALPITWRKSSAGGVEFGTSTDPIRTDPVGTTTQPVSATNLDIRDLASATDSVAALGNVADAAADSGNPVKVGAVGRTANRTAVSDGQRVNITADDLGRLVVIMNQVRDLVTDATTTISTTTETTILAAAASVFHDVTLITVANTSATAVRVDFRDTTGGAVRFSLYVPAGATVGFAPPVPVKQATVNTNWTAQLAAAVTDVRIFVQVVKNV